MSLVPDPLPSLGEALASLAAAAAGRGLLLFGATRERVTRRRILMLLVYELPLIGACAVMGALGCSAVGLEGSPALVIIGLLANKGPAVLDPLLGGLLEPRRRGGRTGT
jgi:hypothetical protein